MSLPLEQLTDQTLKRLDIPDKTVESPQGLSTLYLQKLVNLVYLINDPNQIPHKLDVKAAGAVGAAGQTFTAPINARRLIFSMHFQPVNSGVAGTRNWEVTRRNKAGTKMNYLVRLDVAAVSTTIDFEISMLSSTQLPVDVLQQLTYPMRLEPEWSILIDDLQDIDVAGDTVAWQIEYAEIPL